MMQQIEQLRTNVADEPNIKGLALTMPHWWRKEATMIRALAFAAALCAAVPASAADEAADLAESRLRGCLLAGSSAAPQSGLEAAIISVRSFCAPQIKRVRTDRVKAATAGLSGDSRKAAEERTTLALNDEIARAIANFTGLTS